MVSIEDRLNTFLFEVLKGYPNQERNEGTITLAIDYPVNRAEEVMPLIIASLSKTASPKYYIKVQRMCDTLMYGDNLSRAITSMRLSIRDITIGEYVTELGPLIKPEGDAAIRLEALTNPTNYPRPSKKESQDPRKRKVGLVSTKKK